MASFRWIRTAPYGLRIPLLLLIAAIIAEVVYLIGANVALHARLSGFARASRLDVAFAGAKTLFPGDLRIARLSVSTDRPPLRLEAKSVRASVKPLPLLLGTVTISKLRAREVQIDAPTVRAWLAQTSDMLMEGELAARNGDDARQAAHDADDARQTAHDADEARVQLAIGQASWSPGCPDIRAEVQMHGPNAGLLLDRMAVDPSVRWMIGNLDEHPFELELNVRIGPSSAALENVALTAAQTKAQGSVFVSSDGVRGAFLVARGELRLGVTVGGNQTRFQMSPESSWLSRTLADLSALEPEGAPCTAGLF